MKNNHVTTLEVNLNALKFNLNHFKSKLRQSTEVIAVVKAFAYGSDSIEVAKTIQNDVSYFAVAYTDEGIALRSAGIHTPILVLHPQFTNLETLIEHCLEPNLYNIRILTAFLSIAKEKNLTSYPIHLKFNTGLNRLGFSETDMNAIISTLKDNKVVSVTSIFSHLVASEDEKERDFTLNQIAQFERISSSFMHHFKFMPKRHMSNTSGVINYPQAHFDMVRLGIGLYGFGNDEHETALLQNVVSLKSVISQIHLIKKGESIGYNRAFIAAKSIKTATIPIGHADGISRKLGNGIGYVSIQNKKAPIIGNVCMDMIMVDITGINCQEGDEVIIFDDQKTVEKLANSSHTISYELITAISQRVKRVMV